MKEIPKGPTGKPQRIGLAGKLRIGSIAATGAPPRTPLERALADIWQVVLEKPEISVDDDFFDLGGDSIMATQVASRLRDALQLEVDVSSIFDHPTIQGLAEFLGGSPALLEEK